MKLYLVKNERVVLTSTKDNPLYYFDFPRQVSPCFAETCSRGLRVIPSLSCSRFQPYPVNNYFEQLQKMMDEESNGCKRRKFENDLLVCVRTTKTFFQDPVLYPHSFLPNSTIETLKADMEIAVEGEVLRKLTTLFLKMLGKQLSFKVKVTNMYYEIGGDDVAKAKFCGSTTLDQCCGGLNVETKYTSIPHVTTNVKGFGAKKLVWTNRCWNAWTGKQFTVRGNLTIALILKDVEAVPAVSRPLLPQKPSICERILEEKIAPDVTIIAADKTRILCHKSFLMASSPVLKAMFESNLAEVDTSTVDFSEMMADSVQALLRFLYYESHESMQDNCGVTFELFEAGHKYEIEKLEKTARNTLLTKGTAWFDVATALRLFVLARNLAGGEDLKAKAIQVLRKKMTELDNSSVFQQVFRDTPEVAMDLFKCALPN